jgi:hypothetical protein
MPEDAPQSIREMAEAETQQAAGELFPLGSLEGDEATLGQLIQPNHETHVTVSMGTAEVPMPRGGLLAPDKEHTLLVTCEVSGFEPVPQRDGDRVQGKTIVGWKVREKLRVIYVERVKGEEGSIEAQFADLLRADEQRGAALLDRLKGRVEQALGVSA